MSSINFNYGGNKLKDIKIQDGVLHFKEEQLVNKSYVDQALLSIGGAGGELTSLVFFNTNDLAESSTNKYVSPTEKATWNAKSNFDGNYNSLINKPNIDVNKLSVDTALENKIDKVTGSQLIETTDLASLNCHKNNVTNPHQTSINNLVNTNIVNPINNQWLAYNETTSKWENKTLTIAADEKLKATINSASAKYLNELIDNNTIIMTSDKLICKSIDGITRAELLTLVGMDANIKATLNTLATAGMTFKGVKNRKSDLTSMTGMLTGELYIVLIDESLNNLKTSYIYDGSSWMSLGESNINIRNFSIDKLNLVTEAKGILPQLNMDLTGLVKTTDLNNYVTSTYLTANYASKADLSTKVNRIDIYSKAESDNKYVEKIVGKSLVSNTDIYKIHTHSNMEILDSITSEKITEWDSNSSPITTLSQLTNDTNFISDVDYVHTDSNYTSQDKYKVSKIITTGDGTKFKSDDGTYKTIISGSSGIGINDLSVSPTTTYSSTKITGITGDINDITLPENLIGKSLVDMVKVNFTNANEAKNYIVNAIGDSSLATNTFLEISNSLLTKKQAIVDALATKSIITNQSNDISDYATSINSIVQNSQIKNTKLNKTSGTTSQIVLANPTTIQNISTSVLEYQAGETGAVKYECNFNNGDETSFNTNVNQHLIFDGKMKQDNNVFVTNMTSGDIIGDYSSYSATIDKTQFYKISSITEVNEVLTINSTYAPTLVQANSDIDITGVDRISDIVWTATTTNTSKLLLIYSIDSGVSWKGYDLVNHLVLDIVSISDLSEVNAKGISSIDLNAFTQIDLDNIRNGSPKIRFAYYIEKNSVNDILENDSITLNVDTTGTDIFSTHYTVSFDGIRTLTYTFSADNTYTIIYTDNN